MFVCKYLFVDELLHLVDVYHRAAQGVHGCVLPMADDAEEEMVRSDSVASCPHSLLSREINYRAELIRYAYFHNYILN